MADIVDPATRSRMMSGIRGKDTKPELVVRKGLHRMGFRYRLHDKRLPGKPDVVFSKYHAVIFVHGCFWHGHNCHLFKWPKTREEFWRSKIRGNHESDIRSKTALRETGWRTGVVWECALKGGFRRPVDDVISLCSDWLYSDKLEIEIMGTG